MSGTLFIVATPIGNLEDLTPRARRTLAAVDLVAAEDTRHTGRLLSHIGVKTRLLALHDHNEEQISQKLLAMLLAGESVALVSDAGTPLLSDPGYRLTRDAHASGVTISPIPGASALTAALSTAGLPTDRFCFEGFLPARALARQEALGALADESRTLVFFESVHRIREVLQDMCRVFGAERPAFIGRELTKLHEQCVNATLAALLEQVDEQRIARKGEFVIVVGGAPRVSASSLDVDRLLVELERCLPAKDAARVSARVTGLKKNALYQRLLEIRERSK